MNKKLILVALLFCLVACQTSPTKATRLKDDGIAEAMQEFIDRGELAGAVTLVMVDGQLVHHQVVGWAHIENDISMQLNSVFSIASLTKVITGTAMMILEEEGKLSIDDLASKYIPEFKELRLKDGSKPKREITIKDLMTHTSGLKNRKNDEIKTLVGATEFILDQKMIGEPGDQWVYGPGLTFCGRIIELVSGQSYESFLKERIFVPLKMKDTSFQIRPDMLERLAYVYVPGKNGKGLALAPASQQRLPKEGERLFPNPSGGLRSTAMDMANFYHMLLDEGSFQGKRILSAKQVERMTSIHTKDYDKIGFVPGSAWGLGCGIVKEPTGVTAMLSPGTFGHGGSRGTQSWGDPERGMVLVLMIQRTKFGNGDASDIRRVFQAKAVEAYAD